MMENGIMVFTCTIEFFMSIIKVLKSFLKKGFLKRKKDPLKISSWLLCSHKQPFHVPRDRISEDNCFSVY